MLALHRKWVKNPIFWNKLHTEDQIAVNTYKFFWFDTSLHLFTSIIKNSAINMS